MRLKKIQTEPSRGNGQQNNELHWLARNVGCAWAASTIPRILTGGVTNPSIASVSRSRKYAWDALVPSDQLTEIFVIAVSCCRVEHELKDGCLRFGVLARDI